MPRKTSHNKSKFKTWTQGIAWESTAMLLLSPQRSLPCFYHPVPNPFSLSNLAKYEQEAEWASLHNVTVWVITHHFELLLYDRISFCITTWANNNLISFISLTGTNCNTVSFYQQWYSDQNRADKYNIWCISAVIDDTLAVTITVIYKADKTIKVGGFFACWEKNLWRFKKKKRNAIYIFPMCVLWPKF